MSLNPFDYVYDWSAIVAIFGVSIAILTIYWSNRSSLTGIRTNLQMMFVDWSSECLDTISTSHHLLEYERETFLKKAITCLSSLSSLIDRGRFYLKNDKSLGFGSYKHKAYIGFRREALNELVEIHNLLKSAIDDAELDKLEVRESVIQHKRSFVSHIVESLGTEWFKLRKYRN